MKQCKYCHREQPDLILINGKCTYCIENEKQPLGAVIKSPERPVLTDMLKQLEPKKDITREILKERGSRYGEFIDNAELHDAIMSLLREAIKKNPRKFKPMHLLALDVIVQKMVRMVNGDPDYDDNYQDIIGYSQLVLDQLRRLVRGS